MERNVPYSILEMVRKLTLRSIFCQNEFKTIYRRDKEGGNGLVTVSKTKGVLSPLHPTPSRVQLSVGVCNSSATL